MKQGFDVKVFAFKDDSQAGLGDVIGEALDSSILVIGASTYENELFPKIEYFIKLLAEKVNSEKPVLVISSYGWGPVAEGA